MPPTLEWGIMLDFFHDAKNYTQGCTYVCCTTEENLGPVYLFESEMSAKAFAVFQ